MAAGDVQPWNYWTYPVSTTWNFSAGTQKCPNCGYCSCCGKSDVPGKLAEE